MTDKALRKTFMEQKRASADRVKEAKKVRNSQGRVLMQWLEGVQVSLCWFAAEGETEHAQALFPHASWLVDNARQV